jgi:hypothetical protein
MPARGKLARASTQQFRSTPNGLRSGNRTVGQGRDFVEVFEEEGPGGEVNPAGKRDTRFAEAAREFVVGGVMLIESI